MIMAKMSDGFQSLKQSAGRVGESMKAKTVETRDEQKYTPRSNSLIKYNLQNIVILIGALFIVPSMIFLSNELSMLGLLLGFSIIGFSDYIVEFIRNFKN